MYNNWLKLYENLQQHELLREFAAIGRKIPILRFIKKKYKMEKRQYSEKEKIEIITFYQMLVKMKKNRPNLNVQRIIRKLYPNLCIDLSAY